MEPLERTCLPGLIYGSAGGVELTLDLYHPDLPAGWPRPIPAVIYMHGGGWVRGSSGSPSGVAFALEMAAEGLAVACVNYRLAPRFPAPAAILDCKTALKWLKAHGTQYGIDPDRVVAMGNSAGGHLAAMLALTRPEDGFDPHTFPAVDCSVAACVDLCGIADVAALLGADEPPIWAQAWIPDSTPDRMDLARRCSPVTYVHAQASPTLILHGDADESVPYDQSVDLERCLREAGAAVQLVTIPGAGHMLGVTGSPHVQRQLRTARRNYFARLGFIDSRAIAG
jgi:acetyl esterase/lipase